MDHPELFVPDPALAEEWDNPEMTAFDQLSTFWLTILPNFCR
jgi:hypothetical protein